MRKFGPENPVITMIARMRVLPENQAEYEALMDHVAAMTLEHQPGVVYYAWAKSGDDADAYQVVEVYRDAQVHAAHMASEWVRGAMPRSAALVDGGFDIRQYVSLGSQPVQLTMKKAEPD
jgi:quinol monooxygenase YgiN